VGSLTFMSDTHPSSLDERWAEALTADVVVAHVSDASVGELRELAFRPDKGTPAVGSWSAFDDKIDDLASHAMPNMEARRAFEHLTHALALRGPKPGRDTPHRGMFDAGYLADLDAAAKHLLLRGLLHVADRMAAADCQGAERLLIVGEFKEQLGPFRGKIAHHITHRALAGSNHAALTADIGLRVRITPSGVTVRCSACALNNDRHEDERYHAPRTIRERCVKADAEGMAWHCTRHDRGFEKRATFAEHTPGYDIFRPAGQYDG
jgi:hypothetical protein